MKLISSDWLGALRRYRVDSADVAQSAMPFLPWLTPTVHPRIIELLDQLGHVRFLQKDEKIFHARSPVDKIAYVRAGVTARTAGDPHAQSASAMAIATPGRLATGNLNFFTQRAAFGRYFAVVPAEIVICDRQDVYDVVIHDAELLRIFACQFEASALSDRIAFISMALHDAQSRLKTFSCAWAICFGEMVTDETGLEWIKMPVPLTRQVRASIIKVSSNCIDNILKQWMRAGLYLRKGDCVWIQPHLVEDIYQWMRRTDESVLSRLPSQLTHLIKTIPLKDRVSQNQAVFLKKAG